MATSPSAAPAAKRSLSAEAALDRILARVHPLESVETALGEALGAVLAEDAVADRDVPPFRNSAMDGYAVRGAQTAGTALRVVGSVAAGGMPAGAVGSGEAMRIMTGAPMPDGADTVVRGEDTDNGVDQVTITSDAP